ncbi:MAG: alpha/beta fold hydrolase [Colwellia sp.]|nr:alpha/beta fold hydrolase [Colwellia sp.]
MKFSYFNNGKKGLGLPALGRGFTGLMSIIAPKFSAFLGKNILMKPYAKRHYEFDLLTPEKEFNLQTSIGIAHVNLFGSGSKIIVVSHGWGDSSHTFQQMILSLTQQGYMVAALDHIGHGKSSGNQSHLLSFVETLEILIEHFNEEKMSVYGIVAHSMGAIATLNLPLYALENKKIILISSPINFFELMFEKVEQVGISRRLLTKVLESISHNYGKTWHQLTTESNREKLALDITFIHDSQDRFAPIADVITFLEKEKTPLITTEGLGHRKILGDTKVIENITQVLSC